MIYLESPYKSYPGTKIFPSIISSQGNGIKHQIYASLGIEW